ncbi:MAG TPA: hypothetical protein PLS73_03810 [Saprospiraceae bacterium]|nr:hypothetical protein [Saprospiraceae bacterium]
MKTKNILFNLSIVLFFATSLLCVLHSQSDSIAPVVKKKAILKLSYFSVENQIQFLNFKGLIKTKDKLEPIAYRPIHLYINEASDEKNKIGDFVTNDQGRIQSVISPVFADVWKTNNPITFIARLDSVDEMGTLETETEITKAKIKLDTLFEDEMRKVVAHVYTLEDTNWIPAKDVEIKIGVQRLASVLPINKEASLTTDSSGQAVTEFVLDSIPGDVNGNIQLIAKIEDHELYGNLETKFQVPWGKSSHFVNSHFEGRSLWARGDRVPIWLAFLAYTIIFSVWGTLIYLIIQVLKIRRVGLEKH